MWLISFTLLQFGRTPGLLAQKEGITMDSKPGTPLHL